MAPRYRCNACGGLTRFDVTRTERFRAFYHFTVGGELIEVLERETLDETIESVVCRWCGHGRDIQVIGEATLAD